MSTKKTTELTDIAALLRLHNINATNFYQGNKEKRHSFFVWLEAKEANQDRERYVYLKKNGTSHDIITLTRKMTLDEIQERQKLLFLLQKFYGIHTSSHFSHLAIESAGFYRSILRCQGSLLLHSPLLTKQKKDELFLMQQNEASCFAVFLEKEVGAIQ